MLTACVHDESCAGCQIMQGEQGVVAHVTLPHPSELSAYDKLELDFTLGCPGGHVPICTSLAVPEASSTCISVPNAHG